MAVATPDACAPGGIREWLERELQQDRLATMQLLESRHRRLLQELDTGAAKAASAQLDAVKVDPIGVREIDDFPMPLLTEDSEAQRNLESLETPHKKLAPSDDDKARNSMFQVPRSIKEFVDNPLFDMVFTALIVLAGVMTALQLHYESFDIAYTINMTVASPSTSLHTSAVGPLQGRIIPDPADETWPGVKEILGVLNYVFGVLFIVEILLRMLAHKLRFPCYAWNIFDTLVVALWIFDEVQGGDSNMVVNPIFMRLARLARVLRLVRVLKSLEGMDSLKLIVTSIQGSVNILVWSLMLLAAAMMLVGMIFAFTLQVDMQNENIPLEKRQAIYKYFGSFSRAMLTMFEVTIGNWVPVTRMLADNLGEQWAIILVAYNCCVGFAVVQVIRGVFMRETFKVAATDDELMVIDNQAKKRNFSAKMHQLVARADSSGIGSLTKEDFDAVVSDPTSRHWLAAMELTIPCADKVWKVLDDGDGHVDAEELIQGFGRFKGPAKALDLLFLSNEVQDVQRTLAELRAELAATAQTMASTLKGLHTSDGSFLAAQRSIPPAMPRLPADAQMHAFHSAPNGAVADLPEVF